MTRSCGGVTGGWVRVGYTYTHLTVRHQDKNDIGAAVKSSDSDGGRGT